MIGSAGPVFASYDNEWKLHGRNTRNLRETLLQKCGCLFFSSFRKRKVCLFLGALAWRKKKINKKRAKRKINTHTFEKIYEMMNFYSGFLREYHDLYTHARSSTMKQTWLLRASAEVIVPKTEIAKCASCANNLYEYDGEMNNVRDDSVKLQS